MKDWKKERNKIIGLGEFSASKSYYPELQAKIEELQSAYKNSENILSSMADAVIIHNSIGDFLYLNKKARHMLGIDSKAVTRHNYSDVIVASYSLEQLQQQFNTIEERNDDTIECTVKHLSTNKIVAVEISTNPIQWHGKKALVSVLRDFTVRKNYELSIIEAKRKAEENDKLKSAFLANMSHEIRTPMNGIIGFVDLLKNPHIDEETRQWYLEILNKSCTRLVNTVNDIMEVSTIDAGQVQINITEEDISLLLNNQFIFFKTEAEKKNNTLHVSVPSKATVLNTDRVKLESIVSNLIKNAIKFTKNGDIHFGYKIEKSDVQFFVEDKGIGIAKNRQQAIFERFIQADMKISNGHEGTGLGLSICKSYVELLGGKIWLESEINVGSTFYFTIPLLTKNQ